MHEGSFSFSPRKAELGRLRAELTHLLGGAGWSADDMADVLLAADELATNAVVHARTPFDVHCIVDGHAEVEVTDRDPEHLPVMRPFDADPGAAPDPKPGGFGLRIVDRLAREWQVRRGPGWKQVRMVLERGSGARRSG